MQTEKWQADAADVGWQEHMRRTCWHPMVMMHNCAELKRDVEYWFRADVETGQIWFVALLEGLFREQFELRRFPFDCQWLTVRFTSSFECVRFLRDPAADMVTTYTVDVFDTIGYILEEYEPANFVAVQARKSSRLASSSLAQYQELNVKVMRTRAQTSAHP